MKYVNQLLYPDVPYLTRYELEGEEREKGLKTTIKTSGCGLCSAVMVAHRLVPLCDFELSDAIKMSCDCGANHLKGTDYNRFAPVFAQKLGLDMEVTNDSERLRYCLRSGGAAILYMKGDRNGRVGVFSHIEHYVVALAEERDGRIAVLDPAYKEGRYEEVGRCGKVEMKNGVIALCDMQVITDDAVSEKPAFYLFWRK